MKAEEADFAITKLAAAVGRAGNVELKHGLLSKQILQHDAAAQAVILQAVGAKATEDPSCVRLLLLLSDVESLKKAMGDAAFDSFRKELTGTPQGTMVDRFFRSVASLSPESLPLFRAKCAILLQTVTMINDRLEADRLPVYKLHGFDAAQNIAAESGADDHEVRIELDHLPAASQDAARDVLLEADFDEIDEDNAFLVQLSDEQIKVLGSASGMGMMLGAGGAAKLSEAAAQRKALFIVKRFCLIIRSATMYPADHPGLPPAFEALKSTIENALDDKDQVTLTVVGGDILIDDFKIRKEDRFKKTFCDLFDERSVSSATFREGLTVEELKTFVFCFTESPKTLKDKGGLPKVLERRNVTSIVADQFRYGVVADDGRAAPVAASEGHTVASDDHLLESLIYGEVIKKMQDGNMENLSIEQLGQFLKDTFANPDEDKRRGLARMLLSLDPELMETGFLANPELRRSLSWSAARKTLQHMFRELASEDLDARDHALDTIAQLMDLAIQRRKETTVSTTIQRLLEYLTATETDPDLLARATQIYATMAMSYLRRQKIDKGGALLLLLRQLADGSPEISTTSDGKGQVLYVSFEGRESVLKAADDALIQIGSETDIVDILVTAAMDTEAARAEPAMLLLDALQTDFVVGRLFQVFLDPERSLRSRAYKLLRRRGTGALRAIEHEIESRSLLSHPGRDPMSQQFTQDGDWYILRNCLDLLCDIEPDTAAEVLSAMVKDPDARVRRECVHLLARHGLPGCEAILRSALQDPKSEVRERAIHGVGSLADEGSVEGLIEIFHRYPRHRKTVLRSLEQIASQPCIDFLLKAVETIDARPSRKHQPEFPEDPDALMQALAALGSIGGGEIEARLERFVTRWSSPFWRWFNRPLKGLVSFQEVLKAARSALALSRRKNRPATTAT